MAAPASRIFSNAWLNFQLTNRIPRRALTRFMGWFSKVEQPLVRDASIAVWRAFCDVDLSDARKQRFSSLHDCFIRELAPGARSVDADPSVLASPCDGIVGACGAIGGGTVLQAKGMPYTLAELLQDAALAGSFRGGCYATLRLTAGMYHRFHAPHDGAIDGVDYIAGDAWNVNPPALARIDRLYCRNERAVLAMRLVTGGHRIALVPVAAVLVASIRLRFADVVLHLRRFGSSRIPCRASLAKGEEMGWFEHGSTLIVLAPRGFVLCEHVRQGHRIRMGEPLMRLPPAA